MGGKKGPGENSKKAVGQARKAEAAAGKKAADDAKKAAVEDAEWDKGAKKANAKKESEAAKKAEAARKKAERDALIAEEEKSLPSRSGPKNNKTAQKKTRGLDLSQLGGDDDGDDSSKPLATLNASGIDNALDALGLTDTKTNSVKIDRHPERRQKSAFEAFRERRERELEGSGLNHGALQSRIRKDWDRAPENPKRQMNAKFNSNKEEMAQLRAQANEQTESRLTEK